MIRTGVVVAVGLAVALTGLPTAADGSTGPDTAPSDEVRTAAASDDERDRRLVVLWEEDVPESDRAAALAAIGTRGTPVGSLDTVTVAADARADLPALARELAARDDVAAADVDREIRLAQQPAPRPDDPLFGEQWGLENTGQLLFLDGERSTPGVDVRARAAWAITEGNPSVTVALIDSGVDVTHADLRAGVWTNPGEVADGTDSDGNGFVDDVNGWDFVTGQPIVVAGPDGPAAVVHPEPIAEAHGTQVAGILAARSRDLFGVAGMAPRISLLPVRAFEQADGQGPGSSDLATIVAAISYAVDNGAHLINASWESSTASSVLKRAVADAGIPIVAASGNWGLDLSVGGTAVPAGYRLPNVVAVTAIDSRAALPAFANVGADTIDLGAPGVGIVTTELGGGHLQLTSGAPSGTSFAAPFVSGALALGLSVEPTSSVADLVDTLLRTTTPRAALAGRTTSGGSLDAGAFLAGLDRPICGRDLLPLAGFEDVAVTSVHARAIDCIAAAALTTGYEDGTYRPANTVTRGQLATFLAGIIEAGGMLPVDPPDAFVDDDGSTHESSIDALAAIGILEGDELGRFRPNASVTRGQLAAMTVRTHAVLDGEARERSRAWFPDTAGSTHEAAIGIARDLGLVRGRDRVTYDAAAVTRRDQMASTLARMLDSLAREGVVLTAIGDGGQG